MAITLPQPQTMVDATAWGQPITTEVNRMTPLVVAPTAWTAVTFQNNWINFDANATIRYRKSGDMAQLQGCMKNGTLGYGVAAFTLPTGFRPRADSVFLTPMGGNGVAMVFIQTNGVISVASSAVAGGTNAFVYLDGIAFNAVN